MRGMQRWWSLEYCLVPLLVSCCNALWRTPDRNATGVLLSYCEAETFVAKCDHSHVIRMTKAVYGRMATGRCVINDLGYLGCNADVLHLTDRKCSGKSECKIRIPDGQLDSTKPCYPDLKVYMDASYICMPIDQPKLLCKNQHVIKVTNNDVVISSKSLKKDTSCHPQHGNIFEWTVQAQPGQTLNVSMVDFEWTPSTDHEPSERVLGSVLDKAVQKTTTLFGDDSREKHIITSNGSSLFLRVNASSANNFVLRFQAVGCADLRPPRHAWLHRPHANEAIIGCNDTRQTWHLKCKDKSWVGVIGNCTQHLVAARKQAMLNQSKPLSHDVTIVIIVGISLLICALIVITGLACIKRVAKKPCCKGAQNIKYDNVTTDESVYREQGSDASYLSPKYAPSSQPHPHPRQHRNDYSHIWEHPLPDPMPQQLKVKLPKQQSTETTSTTYHVSMASKNSDADSKYFVLDREPVEQ